MSAKRISEFESIERWAAQRKAAIILEVRKDNVESFNARVRNEAVFTNL